MDSVTSSRTPSSEGTARYVAAKLVIGGPSAAPAKDPKMASAAMVTAMMTSHAIGYRIHRRHKLSIGPSCRT